MMGEIASRLADHVIVTSDNPRSESPEAIIDQILAGARGTPGLKSRAAEPPRRSAVVTSSGARIVARRSRA